jgi:hypothetical protein
MCSNQYKVLKKIPLQGKSLFVVMGQLTLLINIPGIPLLVIHIRACLNAMCAIWLPFKEPPFLAFTTKQNQLAQASMISGL